MCSRYIFSFEKPEYYGSFAFISHSKVKSSTYNRKILRKGVQKIVFFKHYFSELLYASSKKNDYQRDLFQTNLEGMLNHNEPLFRLAQKIDWKKFDTEFGKLYCPDNGRPANPLDGRTGLLKSHI